MNVQRISAFSHGDIGGNPAGVAILDQLPGVDKMQAIARDVGYSETAFAAPQGDKWRVRYFSPEAEVPFCGHATIALGVALGRQFQAGKFDLILSNGHISVDAAKSDQGWTAEFKSPETWSRSLPTDLETQLMTLFGLSDDHINPELPATLAFAGNRHAIIWIRDRAQLARMSYDFDAGQRLMQDHDLTTISQVFIENDTTFVTRNAFAIGGVVEDAATGAAAAALGGALVDLGWPPLQGGGTFAIRQGEDMGQPSDLTVTVSGRSGDRVAVAGAARDI